MRTTSIPGRGQRTTRARHETSRVSGFRRLTLRERQTFLRRVAGDIAAGSQPLSLELADAMIENVVGTFSLPFALGLNLRVNGRDHLVPMAIEEPSVVAAFSRVARLARGGRGITAQASPPIAVVQIHLADVGAPGPAMRAIRNAESRLIALAHRAVPRLVGRGGGVRRISLRRLEHDGSGQRFLTVQLHVDVCDAMGANLVNTVGEAVAPELARLSEGRVVMAILSNLADERIAHAYCTIPATALQFGGLAGETVAERMQEGWRIADADPYRAVTHNKGVMNGIDAAAVALGQDVRALEAGAHSWAARTGRARPLSRFRWNPAAGRLHASIALPMPVSTVGPLKERHPGVALAHRVLGCHRASELAGVLAAVGLCQSLGAVQALVTEGIQRGHMRLHGRKA